MRPDIGENLVRLGLQETREPVGHPGVPATRRRRWKDVVVGARRRAAAGRRLLRTRTVPPRRPPLEREPDARALDTLDDWILFGPRMH